MHAAQGEVNGVRVALYCWERCFVYCLTSLVKIYPRLLRLSPVLKSAAVAVERYIRIRYIIKQVCGTKAQCCIQHDGVYYLFINECSSTSSTNNISHSFCVVESVVLRDALLQPAAVAL